MVVGIFFEEQLSAWVVFGKIISTRSYRCPIKCQVFFLQTFLLVKEICFPGNGCKKVHGEPIVKLWILPFDSNTQGLIIQYFHTGDFIPAQIQNLFGLFFLFCYFCDFLRVCFKSHNIRSHIVKYGGMVLAYRHSFNGVSII